MVVFGYKNFMIMKYGIGVGKGVDCDEVWFILKNSV